VAHKCHSECVERLALTGHRTTNHQINSLSLLETVAEEEDNIITIYA